MDFYKEEEFERTKKQRNVAITVLSVITAVYLASIVTAVIVYGGLPYMDPSEGSLKVGCYLLSVIYVVYLFFAIWKIKRVNTYYQMMLSLKTKDKSVEEGIFLRYEPEMETKNGVDVKKMIISVFSNKRNEYFERVIYVPYEREFPEIEEGKIIVATTQENVLFSYEIKE